MLPSSPLASAVALAPRAASAEGLFDFLFGGAQKQQQHQAPPQANFFADPFGLNQQPRRRRARSPQAAPDPHFACAAATAGISRWRAATRRRFRCARRSVRPARPRSSSAAASTAHRPSTGERYADSENAFAYRKALRADCTCNGRDPAGLAPVDLTLDTSLRPGDVIATTDGLVAYSGVKVGINQTAEFTPVASYPGLTADVRARLGEMKVAPVAAETIANEAPLPEQRTARDLGAEIRIGKRQARRSELAAIESSFGAMRTRRT